MIIRSFRPEDLEQCVELIKETSEHYILEDIIPWKEEMFLGFFDLENKRDKVEEFFKNADVIVAESEDKEILGLLRSTEYNIRSFFIKDKYIRQGIWRKLFNEYLKTLKGKYSIVTVYSSSYAVKFYESLWFQITWEKELRWDGIRAYPMKMTIES